MYLGKCDLKSWWDSPMHMLEYIQLIIMTIPNAGESVEKMDFSFIAGGNAKWYIHWEK